MRVVLPKKIAGNAEECEIMIDQNRAIDSRRIERELGKVPSIILKEIKEKLRLLGNF